MCGKNQWSSGRTPDAQLAWRLVESWPANRRWRISVDRLLSPILYSTLAQILLTTNFCPPPPPQSGIQFQGDRGLKSKNSTGGLFYWAKIMMLQGVGHPMSCLGACCANDPPKGGVYAPATATVNSAPTVPFHFELQRFCNRHLQLPNRFPNCRQRRRHYRAASLSFNRGPPTRHKPVRHTVTGRRTRARMPEPSTPPLSGTPSPVWQPPRPPVRARRRLLPVRPAAAA